MPGRRRARASARERAAPQPGAKGNQSDDGQRQLNAARKEGKNAMPRERKGKRGFSKTASLNLG